MFVPRRSEGDRLKALFAGGWIAALAGFIVLAAFAEEQTRFAGDLWISQHAQRIHSPLFAGSIDLAEAIASAPYVVALIAGPMILLWYFNRRREALLMLAVPLGWSVNAVVKVLVDRPRPSELLVNVTSHPSDASFPSGHVIVAALAFGLIFYVATVLIRHAWRRIAVQVFCVYGVVFTGIARIYHGEHWASDVYGSLLLASLVLAVVIAAHRRTPGASTAAPQPWTPRWSVEEPELRQ